MRLLAVGRLRPGPEADLFARYNARLRPRLSVAEVPEGVGAPAEMKRREAAALSACLKPGAFVIALDLAAPPRSSEAFARDLQAWRDAGHTPHFVIGGAEGLDRALLDRADAGLSLGPLTWPHMLVRVLLAEQLFRAQSIANGHPYHRAGRP